MNKKFRYLCYYPYRVLAKINDGGIVEINGLASEGLVSVKDTDAIDAGMYERLEYLKLLLIPLASINFDQAVSICRASCPLPFEGKNKHLWQIDRKHEADGFSPYLQLVNKYNDYSFTIDLTNGDLTVYLSDELATTDNQAEVIEAYHKNHIDIYGLIAEGEALNKYSVK